ncbi:hypothetical protein CHS0354_024767 [Potamilus streckersoni]|uniref:Uncharacterized protein n=1 Tax=Potamilus streckersoni TaxID=2493646 RepID=A0AAE0RXE4_9BIVA|nr:hypothetical protein CHS0354_024767 [Potamilus streckersoni]
MAAQATAMKTSNSHSKRNTAPKVMNEDCMVHGDKRHVCQFIVNKLAHKGLLKKSSRVKFVNDICACNKELDNSQLFPDEDAVKSYADAAKKAINIWEGKPNTINKVLAELDLDKNRSAAILRFVYYFKKACEGDFKSSASSKKSHKARKKNAEKGK